MKNNKFITITEKNMAVVMGHVNKFFSKPTRRDDGMRPIKIGIQNINCDGTLISVPKYENQHVYTPFIGNCHPHPMYKDYRERKFQNPNMSTFGENMPPLLSIEDRYEDNCLPVYKGNKLFIDGNRMTIIFNDMYYVVNDCHVVNYIPKRTKAETVTFYHMPYEREDIDAKVQHAISIVVNSIDDLSMCDAFKYPSYVYGLENAASIYDGATRQIDRIIKNIDIKKSHAVEKFRIEFSNSVITMHINIDMVRDGLPNYKDLHKVVYFEVNGNKFYNTSSLIKYLSSQS